jgi:hypothetical protein
MKKGMVIFTFGSIAQGFAYLRVRSIGVMLAPCEATRDTTLQNGLFEFSLRLSNSVLAKVMMAFHEEMGTKDRVRTAG